MTSRERFQLAVSHKEPDRVPLDLGAGQACKFTKSFYAKLLDYFGIKDDDAEICQPVLQVVYASDKVLDLLLGDVRNARVRYAENFVSPYAKNWEDSRYKYFTNHFGTTYRMPKDQGLFYDVYDTALACATDEADDNRYIWPCPNRPVKGSRKELADYRASGYSPALSTAYRQPLQQIQNYRPSSCFRSSLRLPFRPSGVHNYLLQSKASRRPLKP